jgi:hypothetical protein
VADDLVSVALKVTQVLDRLGIAFVVGGSVASSAHSFPRTTNDVDLVADVEPEHIGPLVEALEGEFYIDAAMVADALRRGASFNLIHYDTAHKVDVFIRGRDPFRTAQIARRRPESIEDAVLPVSSPEGTILAKLKWYRDAGEVSERQWRDVLDVLRVQAERLDISYLRSSAEQMGLGDLLDRASKEVAARGC